MAAVFAFRPIERADVDELAALVADAFLRYRTFAPPGWRPPPASAEVDVLGRWIKDPDFWGEVASDDRVLVGHATVVPAARHSARPGRDPAVAHLGHLFVKPAYWSSGVAAELLARATAAAAVAKFTTMRLFVPVGQARARRFYEREQFRSVGKPFDLGLGLPVLEYRRRLTP